jgi:hypothetical protein
VPCKQILMRHDCERQCDRELELKLSAEHVFHFNGDD